MCSDLLLGLIVKIITLRVAIKSCANFVVETLVPLGLSHLDRSFRHICFQVNISDVHSPLLRRIIFATLGDPPADLSSVLVATINGNHVGKTLSFSSLDDNGDLVTHSLFSCLVDACPSSLSINTADFTIFFDRIQCYDIFVRGIILTCICDLFLGVGFVDNVAVPVPGTLSEDVLMRSPGFTARLKLSPLFLFFFLSFGAIFGRAIFITLGTLLLPISSSFLYLCLTCIFCRFCLCCFFSCFCFFSILKESSDTLSISCKGQ